MQNSMPSSVRKALQEKVQKLSPKAREVARKLVKARLARLAKQAR